MYRGAVGHIERLDTGEMFLRVGNKSIRAVAHNVPRSNEEEGVCDPTVSNQEFLLQNLSRPIFNLTNLAS
jgi:hypothetical protein